MFKVFKTRNFILTAVLAVMAGFMFAPAHAADAEVIPAGGMTPAEALEYMKTTPNLYILDASPAEAHQRISFIRSHNIPLAEMAERAAEIPKDVPVMIHCRRGLTSRKVVPLVRELRPDIETLSYIDGEPPFEAYNAWKMEKKARKGKGKPKPKKK